MTKTKRNAVRKPLIRGLSPWPEAVDGVELLDEVCCLLQATCNLPSKHHATIATLLKVQSWCTTRRRFKLRKEVEFIKGVPVGGHLFRMERRVIRWVMDHHFELAVKRPNLDEAGDNFDRDGRSALLAIADIAGGNWPSRARAAMRAVNVTYGDMPIVGSELLHDMDKVFRRKQAFSLSSREILTTLNQDKALLWGVFYPKGLKPRQLAAILRHYGVASATVTLANGHRREEYSRAVISRRLHPHFRCAMAYVGWGKSDGSPAGVRFDGALQAIF